MGNVLSKEKREQVVALGRLGWPLRRIEEATGVRRETAGDYLRQAGIVIRQRGSWGEKSLAKAATLVTNGIVRAEAVSPSNPANEVITGSGEECGEQEAKAATLVTTGFLSEKAAV
jgi:hypothetical protein